MSYTELEHGYQVSAIRGNASNTSRVLSAASSGSLSFQGLKNASRPMFYIGDINTVQPPIVGPVIPSIYRSSKRVSFNCVSVSIKIQSRAEFMHAWGITQGAVQKCILYT